jgi:hypothetical protein
MILVVLVGQQPPSSTKEHRTEQRTEQRDCDE